MLPGISFLKTSPRPLMMVSHLPSCELFVQNHIGVTCTFLTSSIVSVCIGRGRKYVKHNRRFLTIIASEADEYAAEKSKTIKGAILARVFDLVRNVKKGNFVKIDSELGRWYVVKDSLARTTIAQSLRDASDKTYRSSKQAKQQRRRRAKISTSVPNRHCDVKTPAIASMMTAVDCAWASFCKARNFDVVNQSVYTEDRGALGDFAHPSNDGMNRLRDILDEVADRMNLNTGVDDDPHYMSPTHVAPTVLKLENQDDASLLRSILKLSSSQLVSETGNPFEPTPLLEFPSQGLLVCPKQRLLFSEVDDEEDEEDFMDLLDRLDVSDIQAALS
jgi:hypothetical protein